MFVVADYSLRRKKIMPIKIGYYKQLQNEKRKVCCSLWNEQFRQDHNDEIDG